MGIELIKASTGFEVSLGYPDNLPTSIVKAVIPSVIQTIAEIAKEGFITTSAIIETIEQVNLKIAYYREYGRFIREDIIPVVALSAAHQDARNLIKSMGLDSDLMQDALDDLERIRQNRRSEL